MGRAPARGEPRAIADFVVEPFEPAYRRVSAAELSARVAAAIAELADCRACPRNCGVSRLCSGP